MSATSADPRFTALVDALAARLQTPLESVDGMVVLVDERHAVRLIVELSAEPDILYAIVPFLAFPSEAEMGELSLRLLQLNADRGALGDACICADVIRRQFVLIERMSLAQEPVAFVLAVEALADLAGMVGADAADEDGAISQAPDTFDAMFQRV